MSIWLTWCALLCLWACVCVCVCVWQAIDAAKGRLGHVSTVGEAADTIAKCAHALSSLAALAQ